ncbi:MAG: TetR/AcrR family transcriptional regulator [Gammaproteobacteria bacterium]|nr:TetR/AcrR family transcriptional regulator [Gammaproteobacteria bacterium]
MSPQAAQRRNPDETRLVLLTAAFEEIHAQGFRKASLDNILKRTGVTKGALYHHFPNKAALGYAVLDEVIMPEYVKIWSPVLDEKLNPVDALVAILERHCSPDFEEQVNLGCPVNNLVQEMSGVDEGFRERLKMMLDEWIRGVRSALERGQANGQVRDDIDADDTARIIVATFEGCTGFAKCSQDPTVFQDSIKALVRFCNGLRQ